MPEIGPGVFVAADLSRGVREQLWDVLSGWWDGLPGGSVVMVWRDDTAAGRLGLSTLGLPPRDCQHFRVWGRTVQLKEPSYATTQRACDSR
jgi:CRISPR-associated endoribonuclease Cas2 subtype I-E